MTINFLDNLLVNPFTKPLYGCKALLHTLVKYDFVEFILQVPTFFLPLLFVFRHGKKCLNISEIFEIFEVRVQIGSDKPFIPWDFSKSRILNIRKVRVGSNIKCFEFFGQPTSRDS